MGGGGARTVAVVPSKMGLGGGLGGPGGPGGAGGGGPGLQMPVPRADLGHLCGGGGLLVVLCGMTVVVFGCSVGMPPFSLNTSVMEKPGKPGACRVSESKGKFRGGPIPAFSTKEHCVLQMLSRLTAS